MWSHYSFCTPFFRQVLLFPVKYYPFPLEGFPRIMYSPFRLCLGSPSAPWWIIKKLLAHNPWSRQCTLCTVYIVNSIVLHCKATISYKKTWTNEIDRHYTTEAENNSYTFQVMPYELQLSKSLCWRILNKCGFSFIWDNLRELYIRVFIRMVMNTSTNILLLQSCGIKHKAVQCTG